MHRVLEQYTPAYCTTHHATKQGQAWNPKARLIAGSRPHHISTGTTFISQVGQAATNCFAARSTIDGACLQPKQLPDKAHLSLFTAVSCTHCPHVQLQGSSPHPLQTAHAQ